ncbi:hypothetical protein C3L33_18737, partial [Rhododendron williamsianum]
MQQHHHTEMEEEMMQQLRSKATELLLREELNESIQKPILTSSQSAKNNLNRYGMALDCFKLALLDPQSGSNSEPIHGLSTGEEEDDTLEVPDVGLFKPEAESGFLDEKLDMGRILLVQKILDVNSLVEDMVSSKVLGKNSGYHGVGAVGLWLLPSFINRACNPNARDFTS